mmetsp:Transcript_31077/g.92546  ORF Transcript_31077/g.92546 Transcript_31077/m.92546 type:complete len:214 (+) Transcript_31077:635-1276(+)
MLARGVQRRTGCRGARTFSRCHSRHPPHSWLHHDAYHVVVAAAAGTGAADGWRTDPPRRVVRQVDHRCAAERLQPRPPSGRRLSRACASKSGRAAVPAGMLLPARAGAASTCHAPCLRGGRPIVVVEGKVHRRRCHGGQLVRADSRGRCCCCCSLCCLYGRCLCCCRPCCVLRQFGCRRGRGPHPKNLNLSVGLRAHARSAPFSLPNVPLSLS